MRRVFGGCALATLGMTGCFASADRVEPGGGTSADTSDSAGRTTSTSSGGTGTGTSGDATSTSSSTTPSTSTTSSGSSTGSGSATSTTTGGTPPGFVQCEEAGITFPDGYPEVGTPEWSLRFCHPLALTNIAASVEIDGNLTSLGLDGAGMVEGSYCWNALAVTVALDGPDVDVVVEATEIEPITCTFTPLP